MTDIPDDIMKAARGSTFGVEGYIDSTMGQETVEVAILAERLRCVEAVLAWGASKERAGPLYYAAADIAAAIMKGPTT